MDKLRLCRQEIERFQIYDFEGELSEVLKKIQDIYNKYQTNIGKPIKVIWRPIPPGGFWESHSIGKPHTKELIFHKFVLESVDEQYGDGKELAIFGYREHTEEELEYEKKQLELQKKNKLAEYKRLKKEFGDA